MPSSDDVPLTPGLKPPAVAAAAPRSPARGRLTRLFATRRKSKLAVCGLVLAVLIVVVVVVPVEVLKSRSSKAASTVSSPWGVTLLVDNDLEGKSSNKSAVLLLSDRPHAAAAADCSALGETLWDVNEAANATTASLQPLLNYLVYRQQATASTRFWIANASGTSDSSNSNSGRGSGRRTIDINGTIALFDSGSHDSSSNSNDSAVALPVLCTQRAPYSIATNANNSAPYRVTVHAPVGPPDNGAGGMAKVVGFRDHNSFRFLGLHYAAQPQRWTYATPYWNRTLSAAVASGAAANAAAAADLPELDATFFRSVCAQNIHATSEDCLYVNVFTPYLPELHEVANTSSTASPKQLRPVMFFLHGGGLTNGAGGLGTTDGGNLASRGDVVVVSINYRLGTLGYLALDAAHGALPGNYGLADQILALDWVRDNIAAFGGDPDRITIFGQSAGAASVRAMMASPQAQGKFAAAAMLSGLGGVHNYGTSYSHYFTVDEATTRVGAPLLDAAGCSSRDSADAVVACLRALPVTTILGLAPVARFLVVDGTYLTSPELPLNRSSLLGDGKDKDADTVTAAPYALLTGTMRDDGMSFISYPTDADADNVTAYLVAQNLNDPPRSASLFPLPTTDSAGRLPVGSAQRASVFNMTVRLATDAMFRCNDQATVRAGLASGLFSAVYLYEFDRTYTYAGGGALAEACRPPRTAARPDGDPSLPYYRCHSGELALVFGNVARLGLPWRDPDGDRAFTGFAVDSFAAFARTHNPTADAAFLAARGFHSTLAMLPKGASPLSAASASDAWLPATNSTGRLPLHVLDWPATRQEAFREQPQCAGLGMGLDYYL